MVLHQYIITTALQATTTPPSIVHIVQSFFQQQRQTNDKLATLYHKWYKQCVIEQTIFHFGTENEVVPIVHDLSTVPYSVTNNVLLVEGTGH